MILKHQYINDPTLVEKVADRPVEPTNVPVDVLVKRPNFLDV